MLTLIQQNTPYKGFSKHKKKEGETMSDPNRQIHTLNVFFGNDSLKSESFSIQEGDYNSAEIACYLYRTNEDGRNEQMNLMDMTVTVVFKKENGRPTPEYSADIDETVVGKIRFCIPQRILKTSGDAAMQIRQYGEDSLINSVVIPFEVTESIYGCNHDDQCKPVTQTLLQKIENALDDFEEKQGEFEEQFSIWEEKMERLESGEEEVINAETHFDFPSIGDPKKIYKAQSEKKLYQWNTVELKYELINESEASGDIGNISIINGGDAIGTA